MLKPFLLNCGICSFLLNCHSKVMLRALQSKTATHQYNNSITHLNVKAKQRQSYCQHCTIWKAAKQQTKVCQPKLLLFNASISHNSSSKRVLPQYSPYSLFRMKHVCAAALFHVCARAAVYSSLFGSGPPRSCIGKQTAHGARLGPQGGGGWTRIRPEVAVAAKKKVGFFFSKNFLSPVAGQVVDVGAC